MEYWLIDAGRKETAPLRPTMIYGHDGAWPSKEPFPVFVSWILQSSRRKTVPNLPHFLLPFSPLPVPPHHVVFKKSSQKRLINPKQMSDRTR